ncbi:MAG: MaoC/PaaZ C-terminal domain-containing protein [Thermaerobacter sp.]|nr:MaoC/PaaZ C-terminal domain-containing protein [Thermaerobacter sp.]
MTGELRMWKQGDTLGPWTEVVTRRHLVQYAGASGDFNPIHYDEEAAKSFGLPGVITHGMFNMGLLARYLEAAAPPGGRLVSFRARFRSMVQPGQTLEITARVIAVSRDAEQERAVVDVSLTVKGQPKAAVAGQAVMMWRDSWGDPGGPSS